MATITFKHYDDDAYFDMDTTPSMLVDYMLLEENGVEFMYKQWGGRRCIATGIKDGVESVSIPNKIYIEGMGNYEVKECWTEDGKRTTNNLQKIKDLSIGSNINKIGFWDYEQLERLTIPTYLKECIERFIEYSPNLKQITIKGMENAKDEIITTEQIIKKRKQINVLRKQQEEERIRKRKEEERLAKYKTFDTYMKGTSNVLKWYYIILCAIPYMFFVVKETAHIHSFGMFLGWCAVVIVSTIGWIIACTLSLYAGRLSKDNKFVLIFCPIVTIPLSWILLNIGLNILSLYSSCSLIGIMDPRFL